MLSWYWGHVCQLVRQNGPCPVNCSRYVISKSKWVGSMIFVLLGWEVVMAKVSRQKENLSII